MEVTLPSGYTATLRDAFLRGDRRDAQRALKVVISADGSRMIEGSIKTEIAGRILRRMLVSWTVPQPLPSQAAAEHLAENILDMLSDEDAEALERAVDPWIERVLRADSAQVLTHSATGIRVTVVRPEDAAKLAELDGWSREAGEADPKPASLPTGTSSSESRELNGPTASGTPPTLS